MYVYLVIAVGLYINVFVKVILAADKQEIKDDVSTI